MTTPTEILDETIYRFNGFFPGQVDMQPIPVAENQHNWFFFGFSMVLLFIAIAQYFSPMRVKLILAAAISYHKMIWLRDQGKVIRNWSTFWLMVSAVITYALFIYQVHVFLPDIHFYETLHPVVTALRFATAIAIIWILKYLVIQITGNLFNNFKSSFLNIISQLVLFIVSAIVILLFVILYQYYSHSVLLYIPLIIIGATYFYMLLRTFLIGRKEGRFSAFYIILYLCTLEIMPVLAAYKWLTSY
jgi:hypothetical protein